MFAFEPLKFVYLQELGVVVESKTRRGTVADQNE